MITQKTEFNASLMVLLGFTSKSQVSREESMKMMYELLGG
jgi:hypothetical protein